MYNPELPVSLDNWVCDGCGLTSGEPLNREHLICVFGKEAIEEADKIFVDLTKLTVGIK